MSDSAQQDKDRPYICPCGKSYLSYPALFTHIKQKHDGKPPGQIIRPRSVNKRGRPRKQMYMPLDSDINQRKYEYRYSSKVLFTSQEQHELGFIINQVQSAKKRYLNKKFNAPISSQHLEHIAQLYTNAQKEGLNSKNLLKIEKKNELKKSLLSLLQPSKGQQYPSETVLESLLNLNIFYISAVQEQRSSSRRPIQSGHQEMQFRTALLQFLDWCKQFLSSLECKNIEILIGLTISYYANEVNDGRNITTTNYVMHLNNFVGLFLNAIANQSTYKLCYLLQGQNPNKFIYLFHEWLCIEQLSHYQIEINPNYGKGQEHSQDHDKSKNLMKIQKKYNDFNQQSI